MVNIEGLDATKLLTFKSIEEGYPITVEKNDVSELVEVHYQFINRETNNVFGYNVSYSGRDSLGGIVEKCIMEDTICRTALEKLGITI